MLIKGHFFSFSMHLELQSYSPFLIVLLEYYHYGKHVKADFGCSIDCIVRPANRDWACQSEGCHTLSNRTSLQ